MLFARYLSDFLAVPLAERVAPGGRQRQHPEQGLGLAAPAQARLLQIEAVPFQFLEQRLNPPALTVQLDRVVVAAKAMPREDQEIAPTEAHAAQADFRPAGFPHAQTPRLLGAKPAETVADFRLTRARRHWHLEIVAHAHHEWNALGPQPAEPFPAHEFAVAAQRPYPLRPELAHVALPEGHPQRGVGVPVMAKVMPEQRDGDVTNADGKHEEVHRVPAPFPSGAVDGEEQFPLKGKGGNDQFGQRALVELYLLEKQLQPPVLGRKIGLALELRGYVVQLHRPGIDNPGDDSGEAATAGEVEFGGFMKADANPVGDGSRHGGVLREEVL